MRWTWLWRGQSLLIFMGEVLFPRVATESECKFGEIPHFGENDLKCNILKILLQFLYMRDGETFVPPAALYYKSHHSPGGYSPGDGTLVG